ncbi:histidine triad nucleotide-binding protein [Bacteriovorax sp. Seq25_V]|uniref:histidine triad nucleotide-binding protein n=1 Tax=Bacteriovorax sp. Seq25_V TaxID=1201288 RepID=UPI000389F0F6|nr:histidine triad nucleotide-binding protein [Bacteriovorax sp. Seq25_V]EQC47362.1 scavenger mRNA decapping enzyme [Bacteriovorax sp. Seq25_V]
MEDCLFCKILKKEIPSTKVYEDEKVYGFVDIYPMSKEHYLFIHKNHTSNVNEMSKATPNEIGEVYQAISKYTESNELSKNGFRVVTNVGPDAGQTVFHTHFHVLGGEKLGRFGS